MEMKVEKVLIPSEMNVRDVAFMQAALDLALIRYPEEEVFFDDRIENSPLCTAYSEDPETLGRCKPECPFDQTMLLLADGTKESLCHFITNRNSIEESVETKPAIELAAFVAMARCIWLVTDENIANGKDELAPNMELIDADGKPYIKSVRVLPAKPIEGSGYVEVPTGVKEK